MTEFSTDYFDGTAVINGIPYYKLFIKSVKHFSSGTIVESTQGPSYVRETPDGKFYRINFGENYEQQFFDNGNVLSATIGSPMEPYQQDCSVTGIDMVMLGSQPLKRIKGTWPYENSGSVEGIGQIGTACPYPTSSVRWLCCYTEDGQTLQFYSSFSCDDFPVPVRNGGLGISTQSTRAARIYPNPAGQSVTIETLLAGLPFSISDLSGRGILEGKLDNLSQTIDISAFPSGIYLVKIGTGEAEKLIKL